MKRLFLIDGARGAGRSTLAADLAQAHSKSVVVDDHEFGAVFSDRAIGRPRYMNHLDVPELLRVARANPTFAIILVGRVDVDPLRELISGFAPDLVFQIIARKGGQDSAGKLASTLHAMVDMRESPTDIEARNARGHWKGGDPMSHFIRVLDEQGAEVEEVVEVNVAEGWLIRNKIGPDGKPMVGGGMFLTERLEGKFRVEQVADSST